MKKFKSLQEFITFLFQGPHEGHLKFENSQSSTHPTILVFNEIEFDFELDFAQFEIEFSNKLDETKSLVVGNQTLGIPDEKLDESSELKKCCSNKIEKWNSSTWLLFAFDSCNFKSFTLASGNGRLITRFKNCEFYKHFDLENGIFNKVRLQYCRFKGYTNFKNTKFQDLADFYYSTFHQKTIFYKTDFLKTLVLTATTFRENVLFTYTLFEGTLILRGTNVQKGIDLSLAIFCNETVISHFAFDIDYSKYVSQDIETSNSTEYDDYDYFVSEDGVIPHANRIETYRILKAYCFKSLDITAAYRFAQFELKAKREYLNSGSYFQDTKCITGKVPYDEKKIFSNGRLNRYANRFVLFLNHHSNMYGQSWTAGVIFIIVVSFVLYVGVSISYYWNNLEPCLYADNIFSHDSIKGYFTFLNPLHNPEDIFTNRKPDIPILFYLFETLGRVLVGYGFYQTAAAFRKYRAR